MPYNRVSAMGVQHGLVNPEEQFNAQRSDAVRRAHMAALMAGSGGGGAPRPDGGVGNDQFARDFEATHPKNTSGGVGAGGLPLTQIAAFDRQVKAGMDMQGLQGSQEMDLQKQRGADSLGIVREQMGPAKSRDAREQGAYDMQLPFRQQQMDAQKKLLEEAMSPGGQSIGLAGPTQDGSSLTSTSKAGGRFAGEDLADIQMALSGGGQIPDLAKRKLDRQKMALESRLLEQQTKESEANFADRDVERNANKLTNQGKVGEANKVRTSQGIAPEYKPIELFQTDPELAAGISNLKKQTDGYGSALSSFNDAMNVVNLGNKRAPTRGERDAGVKQRVSAAMQSLMQLALAKGLDPIQAKAFALQQIQPTMGQDYLGQ